VTSAFRTGLARGFFRLSAAALLVLTAVGCSFTDDSDGGGAISVPTPSTSAAKLCRALHQQLPEKVNGLRRRTTKPVSDYTAAWGNPAVQLRCGVPRPAKLSPGSADYNPGAEAIEVNGVSWLPQKLSGGYRFTTVLRKAYVEVTVPAKYAPEVNPLLDLAKPVGKTVPVGVV
jgi:hypothetical protein